MTNRVLTAYAFRWRIVDRDREVPMRDIQIAIIPIQNGNE